MKEILKNFTGERIELSEPFTVGDFTYATNGAIMVRISKLHGFSAGNDGHPKNIDVVWKQFPTTETEWTKLPEDDRDPIVERCKKCYGTGDHGCLVIGCEDTHPCGTCGASGKVETDREEIIEHRKFNARFLDKIAKLPNAKIAAKFGLERDPLPFRFDGGEGLLMPLRR